MIPLIPLFLLAACTGKDGPSYTGPYKVGSASACLYDGGEAPTERDETEVYDITGSVYEEKAGADVVGDLHPCDQISRILTIIADDGLIYDLGYGYYDEHGKDLTQALDVRSGDSVYLHFVSVESFGQAEGFVLQDNDSVIGALEVGTWGPALEDGAFPGLTVSAGDPVGGGSEDCGDVVATEMVFTGDAERRITPVEDELITAGATAYRAYALASWDYETTTCTDVGGAQIWAAMR